MEKVYQFLCEFSNNTHPTKKHLIKRYGIEAVAEALENGWIDLFDQTDLSEVRYFITECGECKRDQ